MSKKPAGYIYISSSIVSDYLNVQSELRNPLTDLPQILIEELGNTCKCLFKSG